jgi:hypothetical protein
MRITAVESTVLVTVGYDQACRRLRLEFRSRAIYDYFDVPDAVHQALLEAESKGNYFNEVIRDRFPVRRIAAWDLGASPVVAGRR